MARYVDADEILKKLPDDLKYKSSVKRVLRSAPKIDVLPASEAEKWYHEFHVMKDAYLRECEFHRETNKFADYYEELYQEAVKRVGSGKDLAVPLKNIAVLGYELSVASFGGTRIPEIKITCKSVPNEEGTVVVRKMNDRQIMDDVLNVLKMFERHKEATMTEGAGEDAENS